MHLSENFFSVLPKNIIADITKHFIIFRNQDNKKACFSGKRVQLMSYSPDYGEGFVEITEKEAKDRHLGKMRCLGTIKSEQELLVLLSKYFAFEVTQILVNIPKITLKKKESKRLKKKLELRVNQIPQDRDEKELIIAYRNTTDLKVRDKIFKTILFQRGVNGKTWSQIIRNYISYNKHKFSCFQDRTEEDFYQDILMAFHKQVSVWFDVSLDFCFSTYAWFVIKCAFSRILQTLSTQKRHTSLTKNIELDDPEFSWNESISAENTLQRQSNFEDEFVSRSLCEHIEAMYELKSINAPNALKEELLDIIRDKSTMQNPIYSLAKKYNVDVTEVFVLERDLRDNLKNSMIRDIMLYLKYDVNADEQIATKYCRSKGHVIKTRRNFVATVQSKLERVNV